MLFTTIIGLVTTLAFAAKKWFIKLKFLFTSGGAAASADSKKLPLVIFSDSKRYWNVFKPICDEMEKRGQECHYWTISPDDPALNEKYEHVTCTFIGEGNRGYARLNMMNARICLSTTPGLDVYQWRRSKDTNYYVHISHAAGGYTMYRMFGLDFYDAVLLTGTYQDDEVKSLEKVRNLPTKETLVTGSTYLDLLDERIKKAGVREKKKSNPVVLLAPSWGPSSILNKFGDEFLEGLKKTGYEIIVRPHPQSSTSEKDLLTRLEKKFPESENWHWNYDNDNFDALMNSDIMITDYSGVIFEYALVFDGPVIYTDTEMDLSPYDACWLDTQTWKNGILPTIGRKITKEDIPVIRELIDETLTDDSINAGREQARNDAWMYRGEGAARTADYLIDKLKSFEEPKE
jgi:hypothetical protein